MTEQYIDIYLSDIKPNPRYMRTEDDRLDILGQILLSYYEIMVPIRSKLPSELKKQIPPFTMKARGTILDTPLTMQIICNMSKQPREQVRLANELLGNSGFPLRLNPVV